MMDNAESTNSLGKNTKSIASLTGIRGVAATGVVLYHIYYLSSIYGYDVISDISFLSKGWMGVDLFFILSGFILMFVHADDFYDLNSKTLLRFARLRFWRVYPLNTAILILILCLVSVDGGFRSWFQSEGLGNLSVAAFFKTLVLGNRWLPIRGEWNQPAWSISVEVLGYVVFPLLSMGVMKCSRQMCIVAVVALLVVFAVLSTAFGKVNNNDIHAWALVRMSFGFSIGAILYRIWRLRPVGEISFQAPVSLLCITGILATCIFPKTMFLTESFFSGLIYSLASQKGPVNFLLSTRPIMFLGQISFPLYLLHDMPLVWLMYQLQQHVAGTFYVIGWLCAYLVLVTLMSYLLHVCVERPSHHLARRRIATGGKGRFFPRTHNAGSSSP